MENTIVAGTMVVAVRIIGHNHAREIFRTSSAVFQSIRHIFGLCAATQHTAGDRRALFSLYASPSQKRKKRDHGFAHSSNRYVPRRAGALAHTFCQSGKLRWRRNVGTREKVGPLKAGGGERGGRGREGWENRCAQ